MNEFALFAVGCVVFVATMTAAFILGFSRFERWEREDAEQVALDARV